MLAFTSDYRSVEYLTGSFLVGNIAISKPRSAAFLLALAITGLAFLFLRSTRIGKAVRATSQNREVAEVCGINVRRIDLITFGLGAGLAGAGGSLVSVMFAVYPEMGQVYVFKSFLVIVLGGAGNYPGAFFGGLLLGVIEGLSSLFLTAQLTEVVSYVLLVALLLLRPQGLLGGRT
jgi:branched-chain amino acid transport system permease protein